MVTGVIRRLALTSLTATAVMTAAVASSALAHIHAEPHEVQAGSTATIGFTIEHGCGGSPTTAVDVLLPEGVTDVTPEPFGDWTITTDTTDEGDVVTFEGGGLPDGEAGTFEITMTLPPTPDTTIWFPMVQRCEDGELRWIEIPVEGEAEPDSPAPGVQLIGPVATTTVPVTAPETPDTTTVDTTPTETAPETTPPATTDVVTTDAPDTTGDTVADTAIDEDDDSNVGTIVFIVTVAAVIAVGALAYVFARRGRRDDGDAPTDATV